MLFPRLTLRVAAPFLVLVLVTTVALDVFLSELLAEEQRQRFREVAMANSRFITERSLPTGPQLAGDLRKVTGHRVFFRKAGDVQPVALEDLADVPMTTVPADGEVHRHGAFEVVAVPVEGAGDLLLVRPTVNTLLDPRVLQAVAAFQLLTLLTAWIVVLGIARPLRRLARQLPTIDQPDATEVPEATRRDEIGDVARAFVRTREALQQEREGRQRAEKLAVLGRMTAALAHEVQNPVAAIRMHAQLLHGEGETARIIEHEAQRISDLLDQWKFLTRPEAPVTRPVDVAGTLQRVVAAHRLQAEHTDVRCVLDATPGRIVRGDEKRLEQVFRNLLINALQAMPDGGELTIRVGAADDQVEVRFLDTGRGFSPEALRRVGEFFYSEKEGGMGIGLSVATEILKAHGGSLSASNRPGGGAEVLVRLPAALETPQPST